MIFDRLLALLWTTPAPDARPRTMRAETATASVVAGWRSTRLPVAGLTVAEVRRRVGRYLDVAPYAIPLVNGRRAPATRRLIEGDVLEFVHPADGMRRGRRRPRPPHLRAVEP